MADIALPKTLRQRIALARLSGDNGYQNALLQIADRDMETIEHWSRPLIKEERTQRNNLIFDLWLAGETTTEIAEKMVMGQQTISDILKDTATAKAAASGITEKPPIYNVWNYSNCDPRFGQKHPGQIPGQAVVNLLLWLTKPFDFVVDPMAGGGTTLDACRYLLRRYRCFDIEPRRNDIQQWDIRHGYPHCPQKPSLIVLDPPYWRLKRNEYSNDSAAIGSYDEWLAFMAKLAKDSFKALKDRGHVALFIESFLDERETGRFLFLNRDCLNLFEKAGFDGIQEISVNMTSQIKSFRDVEYAKRKGILLDLKREVFVFRRK